MNAVQEVSDFDTVVSENEHLNTKNRHIVLIAMCLLYYA